MVRWVWWHMPVIPALRRLRQASLNYRERPCLKTTKQNKKHGEATLLNRALLTFSQVSHA
jgi:hypothetical protein